MLQHHAVAQGSGVNENWPQVLDEYGAQFLVLDCRSDADLLEMFRSQSAWTVDFEDGKAVVFVRTDTVRRVLNDSPEKTQDCQRIEPIEPILFHFRPLHPLNPLMALGLFSLES